MLSRLSLSLIIGLALGLTAVAVIRPLQPAGAVLIIFLGLLLGAVISTPLTLLFDRLRRPDRSGD